MIYIVGLIFLYALLSLILKARRVANLTGANGQRIGYRRVFMSHRRNVDRPIRSITSQIILSCAGLTLIALGALAFWPVTKALKTGRVPTLAVVFGSNRDVPRHASPGAYWIILAMLVFGAVMGICSGLFGLLEVFSEQKRRRDAAGKA